MIRQGPWKYVYYAGGHPCQLFNLETDPDELTDFGEDPDYEGVRKITHSYLTSILDPVEVNAQAFADQEALLESYGGTEKVLAMPSFNHTPVES
jgi:choline-sulfatase